LGQAGGEQISRGTAGEESSFQARVRGSYRVGIAVDDGGASCKNKGARGKEERLPLYLGSQGKEKQ
jgi:hypothetical protein